MLVSECDIHILLILDRCLFFSRHCDNIVSPVIRLDFGSLDGKPVATIPWTGPPVMLTVEAHVADDLGKVYSWRYSDQRTDNVRQQTIPIA